MQGAALRGVDSSASRCALWECAEVMLVLLGASRDFSLAFLVGLKVGQCLCDFLFSHDGSPVDFPSGPVAKASQ